MINLLPNDMKQAIRYARMNRRLAWYWLVAIVSGVVLVGIMFYGQYIIADSREQIESDLQESKTNIAELESINKEAQALSSSINTIDQLLNREVRFSGLLQEIGAVIPPGAVLGSLTLSENRTGPITLEVNAVSAEVIGVTQENLAASELFAGADITSVQAQNDANSEYKFVGTLNAFFQAQPPAQQNQGGGS